MDEYEWIGTASAGPNDPDPNPDRPDEPARTLLRSAREGAIAGLRRATLFFGPLAILCLIPGVVLAAIGVGSGRGWPIAPGLVLPNYLTGPFGVYGALVILATMVGGPLGMFRAVFAGARPGT